MKRANAEGVRGLSSFLWRPRDRVENVGADSFKHLKGRGNLDSASKRTLQCKDAGPESRLTSSLQRTCWQPSPHQIRKHENRLRPKCVRAKSALSASAFAKYVRSPPDRPL